MLKIASDDARDILERSSARETAARVAAAVSPRRYSRNLASRSTPTCVALVPSSFRRTCSSNARPSRPRSAAALTRRRPVPEGAHRRCARQGRVAGRGVRRHRRGACPGARKLRVGSRPPDFPSGCRGCFRFPPSRAWSSGLASRRRDVPGSLVHDSIYYDGARGFTRSGNNAGGLEGGHDHGRAPRHGLRDEAHPDHDAAA